MECFRAELNFLFLRIGIYTKKGIIMSETNILSHYVNSQCLSNVVFSTLDEKCFDETLPSASPALDSGKIDLSHRSNIARKHNGDGGGILTGCIDQHSYPPEFENPDIVRVSNDTNGKRPNGSSYNPVLSSDGSIAVFESGANNLVAGDNNGRSDIFVVDTKNNITERISITSGGEESNDESYQPSISADGRFVSFLSLATNLVSNCNNGKMQLFVYDRQEKKLECASVSSSGEQANADVYSASMSADGNYMTFNSGATNLTPPCTRNGIDSIFRYDLRSKKMVCASVTYDGWVANGNSGAPSVSGDGGLIVFGSWADNLVIPKDENGHYDIFLQNMTSGVIKMFSTASNGNVQGNADSSLPSVSSDGKTAAFVSQASNLMSGSVPDGTSNWWKLFTVDVESGEFKKCSNIVTGKAYNVGEFSDKEMPTVSSDGRFVAFEAAESLTPDDVNGVVDVYVCDNANGHIARVSKAIENGKEITDGSESPSFSGDGRFIAFSSISDLLSDVFVAKNPLYSDQ